MRRHDAMRFREGVSLRRPCGGLSIGRLDDAARFGSASTAGGQCGVAHDLTSWSARKEGFLSGVSAMLLDSALHLDLEGDGGMIMLMRPTI